MTVRALERARHELKKKRTSLVFSLIWLSGICRVDFCLGLLCCVASLILQYGPFGRQSFRCKQSHWAPGKRRLLITVTQTEVVVGCIEADVVPCWPNVVRWLHLCGSHALAPLPPTCSWFLGILLSLCCTSYRPPLHCVQHWWSSFVNLSPFLLYFISTIHFPSKIDFPQSHFRT